MSSNYQQLPDLRLLSITQLGGGWFGRAWGLHSKLFSIFINCYFSGVLILPEQELTSFSCFVKHWNPTRLLTPGFTLPGQNWYREALENLHFAYNVRLGPCICLQEEVQATAGCVNSAPLHNRLNRKVFWQDGKKCWTAVDFVQMTYLGLHLV